MKKHATSLLDRQVLSDAAWLAMKKFNPVTAASNPVMFVVLIGTVITGAITLQRLFTGQSFAFELTTTLVLFFTVWFANFAESVAEARGSGTGRQSALCQTRAQSPSS
jgi:K+-transporting ATPase ATPase B chain